MDAQNGLGGTSIWMVWLAAERPLHINDGGFLYHCFKLVFFRQQSGNNLQLHPAQKRKNDLMGDGSTSQRKSGSVSASCVRASSSRSLCAAVFGAIVVRSMGGGPRATFYEGAGFGPLIHRLTSRCRWKDNNFTLDKRCLSEQFPLWMEYASL